MREKRQSTHLLLNLLLFLLLLFFGGRGSGGGSSSRGGDGLSVLGLQELLLLVLRETGEVSSGNGRVVGSGSGFGRSLLRTEQTSNERQFWFTLLSTEKERGEMRLTASPP
jgi:hypothetical protein